MAFHNPFETQTNRDKKQTDRERETAITESSRQFNDTIQSAKVCYNHPLFQEYLLKLNNTSKALLEQFLLTPSTDVFTESIRVKLNAIRLLGIDVVSQAAIKLRPAEDKNEKRA